MPNFYAEVILNSPRFNDPETVSDPALLEPVTLARVLAIIAEAKTSKGIDLMIFETYRSRERQRALYRQNATKLEEVGAHHFGLACDIVKSVNGQPSWKGDFSFLGRLAKKHGLIWGGDWGNPGVTPKFYDGAHVQRVAVKKQNALFKGSWYPDEAYSPYEA